MNIYANDLSLLDFNYTDSFVDPYSHRRFSGSLEPGIFFHSYGYDPLSVRVRDDYGVRNRSPPKHRHDGTSPLPLGMDWTPSPLKREGQNSLRPDDSHTGWSYCFTIPSWVYLPKSRDSEPVAYYRVQVGIQSPERVTTTRVILRRFNDFLKLFSELKKAFPMKDLPPPPSKSLLRMKSETLLDERRCSLEDWMQKLLSDILISRSVQVAMFLELESAVRTLFDEMNEQSSDIKTSIKANSDASAVVIDHGDETPSEISEFGTPRHDDSDFTDQRDLIDSSETAVNSGKLHGNFFRESLQRFSKQKMPTGIEGGGMARDRVSQGTVDGKLLRLDGTKFFTELDDHKQDALRSSTESLGSDLSSASSAMANVDGDLSDIKSDLQLPMDLLIALPSDERQKLNRVLVTLQQRLATARTDVENLIARLNQEVAVRQFLSTKVKDLEVELETTRQNCKENMQQTVLTEKERFTQMQWDVEELRRKCLELEIKLKSEEEGKVHAESSKMSIVNENKRLLQELDFAREQLENLQKHHDDFEMKSKADVKLLVKEVKALRSSQSDLKQEFSQLMKEKLELEKSIQKEKQRAENAYSANAKLLHECGILRHRLQECSVNFLIEEEDKLILDTSSPSDARDLLSTSDNRIGLLLAEAQLLAQDLENAVAVDGDSHINGGDIVKTEDELRKMVTDILVDNARLRMQVNSVILCSLISNGKAENDENEDEDVPLRKTVLSKFFES